MKKSLFVLSAVTLLWVGCKKDEVTTCQSAIRFVNGSNYPFKITIDGKELDSVKGAQTLAVPLQSGKYQVVTEQKDGFTATPATAEHYVSLGVCDTQTIFIHKTKNKLDQ